MHIDYNVAPSDSEENSRVVENGDLPSPIRLEMPLHLDRPSPDVQQQLAFLDIQAQVREHFIYEIWTGKRYGIDPNLAAETSPKFLGSHLGNCSFWESFISHA